VQRIVCNNTPGIVAANDVTCTPRMIPTWAHVRVSDRARAFEFNECSI